MPTELTTVRTKAELRKFIHLPYSIHKNHGNWMPPMLVDEWRFFKPAKNKAFQYSDTLLLLAWKNGQIRGRIMGIINRRYNEQHGEKTARFGYLDCYDDQETAHCLIQEVERWASQLGMTKIIGPYGFSDKDPQGLMIEGFDYQPVIASPCNEAYLPLLVEKEGYTKEVDCLMFRFDLNQELPDLYKHIYQRCSANTEYRLLELTRKRDLKPYIVPILEMVNETYSHIYGFTPMEIDEMKELAARYLPIINPRFVKIILHHGQVAAFILGLPNLTKGIQRSGGRLFPVGIFHLLWAARLTKQLDVMLGGVLPAHQGKGLEVCMGVKLIESAREENYERFEIHLVLETNTRMLAEMQKAGAVPHKRFRVYQKPLLPPSP